MVLIIDNYDSFTYNLVQYFQCLGKKVSVFLNDRITLAEIAMLNPTHIVISPGPNAPEQAGISLAVIQEFASQLPILGVCLGHQALAQAFGGKIIQAPAIMHGKTSPISHFKKGLFYNLPQSFQVTRYHSLAVEENSLPQELRIDAMSKGIIMAISHRLLPLFGIQFHPEAILTEYGLELLNNFLNYPYERTI